jgi:transposase
VELPNDIAGLQALVMKLLNRIEELEAENAELKRRLNQNSHNSHKPPSSEGLQKKPALAKPKKGKQGGQFGHKGKTLEMSATPDEVHLLQAKICSCGTSLEGTAQELAERRQVFDLPEPALQVKEYQRYTCSCPCCGKSNTVAFPAQAVAPVQYGNGVKALVVLLSIGYKLPFLKISRLFADLFGSTINESTIASATKGCYHKLAESEGVIKQALKQSAVNHFDETGLRVAGKLCWLHDCSNEHFTYLFVHQKRGRKALEDPLSILPIYQGWALHDCWQSYFSFSGCRHALCGAHLLRELTALQEEASPWAGHFKRYLLALYHLTEQGTKALDEQLQAKALRLYNLLCEYADEQEAPVQKNRKGRPKASKGRNLLNRLVKHQQAVLAFAFYQEVPFTNNQAERDLRPAKIKQKIAGCFRTFHGAQIYTRIQGFASTLRKQGLEVFKNLQDVINNDFRPNDLIASVPK